MASQGLAPPCPPPLLAAQALCPQASAPTPSITLAVVQRCEWGKMGGHDPGSQWFGVGQCRHRPPITWNTPSSEGCSDSHSGESMNWCGKM